MVRFFQSAYLSRYLLILLLTIIFWAPSLIVKTNFNGEALPFFNAFVWIFGSNYYLLISVAFLITLISALALNQACSEFGISDRVSTLGGFLYVLLASSSSNFTTMTPFIPATFILLLLIRLLYDIPHSKTQIPLAYNSGFLVGLAALFYTQIAFLILVVWIAFYIHRTGTWRAYAVSAVGIGTPYLFIFVWYFWTDQLNEFIFIWIKLFTPGDLNQFLKIGLMNTITSVYIFVFVLYAMLKVLAGLREKSINLRRNLMVTFYFFIVVVGIVVFSGQPDGMYLFIIPSTVLLVQVLNKPSKERILNLSLTILLLLIAVNQYSKLTSLL